MHASKCLSQAKNLCSQITRLLVSFHPHSTLKQSCEVSAWIGNFIILIACSGIFCFFPCDKRSRVAQWKHAGPITQRSVDRNYALLEIFFPFSIISLISFTLHSLIAVMPVISVMKVKTLKIDKCTACKRLSFLKHRSIVHQFLS